jgi:hypothetical protein
MNFEDLLKKVGDLPCFSTGFLAAGEDLTQVRLQLSRWVNSGRCIKLHKGLYTLSQPYRKVKAEPFVIANILKQSSYVSCQSALAWYGLIPEFVPVVTSVTTVRPQIIETPIGRFEYRHIRKNFFNEYRQVELSPNQKAFIALPEKALLDLVYLTADSDRMEFLEELRLQNVDRFNKDALRRIAEQSQSPKLLRAVSNIEKIIEEGEGQQL